MRLIDGGSLDELCVYNVFTLSGTRPSGRTTVHLATGRTTHGLLYIKHGAAHFRSDTGQTLTVCDGELLFLPKYKKYKMQYTAKETSFVLINFEMIVPGGEECTLADEFTVLLKDSAAGRIEHMMSLFESCGTLRGFTATLRKQELVYRLLGMIYENITAPSVNATLYPQILPGVRLLEQTYLENLPIVTFANACHISVSSFRNLFHKKLGMSPVQYRNVLRIKHAGMLLGEGCCTVSEAAYACGFENLGYFCRCYKKITGESPGSTKKSAQ
ncbi:MAG: helix-turn-helix transcriptional regulator [Clostridia bacterium]|nr:helix-turn-helix transcriptional regulator [Clostridia bacterium]